MGSTTFDYNYLIAKTPLYFPDSNKFNVTESKDNR